MNSVSRTSGWDLISERNRELRNAAMVRHESARRVKLWVGVTLLASAVYIAVTLYASQVAGAWGNPLP